MAKSSGGHGPHYSRRRDQPVVAVEKSISGRRDVVDFAENPAPCGRRIRLLNPATISKNLEQTSAVPTENPIHLVAIELTGLR